MSAATPFPRIPESAELERRLLFKHAPLGIAQCSHQGTVIAMNPALEHILGGTLATLPSPHFGDLVRSADPEESHRLFQQMIDGERDSFRIDHHRPGTGGGPSWIRWTAWRVPGSGGKPDSGFIVAEDTTDPRQSELRLRQAERLEAVGRLASGVAHDFNNLLTGVLLYCDLLLIGLDPGHHLRRHVEEIRSAGLQATALVRQLLAVARPQTAEPRLLSLNDVVEGMRTLLERLIGENIQLQFLLDRNLGLVNMDPTQAQQIVLNLVLNSRDALPEGGSITVETRNCQIQVLGERIAGDNSAPLPCAVLVISDNGKGMDAETRSHLFDAFFTTKAPGRGTGLGLTTVHDLVTRSGGLIHVDSELGAGTRAAAPGSPVRFAVTCAQHWIQQSRGHDHNRKRIFIMTSAAVGPQFTTPQIQPANFLNLLIVDDERSIREACREVAQSLGFSAFVADSAEHAFRVLETQAIDSVLLDLRLPGAGGLEALRRIKERRPEAVVVVVTGYGTVQSAVQAMKNGAYDYVTKPFSLDELKLLLERVSSHLRLKTENRLLREKVKSKQGFGGIVGRAPEMEKLYRIIAKAANSAHPVLILGESGTGKEMVARSIHYSGPFRDKPFIPVDCGSLVPTLVESELFGYVKGAFTGANQAKEGLLAIAEGGTVFLDEVGELPVDLQAKLLRAIQEKEIRPVGSTRRVPINVRILAATNRDLEQAVTQGAFRRDLYFRLNVLSLRIPALRERRADIPLLIAHFMERMSRTSGQAKTLSDDSLKAMLAYDWPGNVRELENCLERTFAFTSGPVIHTTDLPPEVANLPLNQSAGGGGHEAQPRIIPMAQLEKQTILSAIAELNGDKLQAARLLGIGKTTLYRKLKDYALEQPAG